VKLPFGVVGPILAVGGTIVALAAGDSLVVAVPATGVAVLGAAVLLAEAAWRSRAPPAPRPAAPAPPFGASVRSALRSGRAGRLAVVQALDRVERAIAQPARPVTTPDEQRAILDWSPEEFRRYVAQRLDALEGVR